MKKFDSAGRPAFGKNGRDYEINVAADPRGNQRIALYVGDSEFMSVPYDPANPDASVASFLETANKFFDPVARSAPTPAEDAALDSRLRAVKMENGRLKEV